MGDEWKEGNNDSNVTWIDAKFNWKKVGTNSAWHQFSPKISKWILVNELFSHSIMGERVEELVGKWWVTVTSNGPLE